MNQNLDFLAWMIICILWKKIVCDFAVEVINIHAMPYNCECFILWWCILLSLNFFIGSNRCVCTKYQELCILTELYMIYIFMQIVITSLSDKTAVTLLILLLHYFLLFVVVGAIWPNTFLLDKNVPIGPASLELRWMHYITIIQIIRHCFWEL